MAGDGALAAVSDAVLGIAGDLSIDVVLARLVHAARDLAGARYAALGVPDDDGGFARFITAGMTDDEIEAMGPLPRTHGLLGAMLADPAPYRTDDVTADPRFRGWWPATHPRMRSFLGVPIVFRGDVIGAFYVTDKVGTDKVGTDKVGADTVGAGAFTAEDEELVGVLAAHAAVLMEHARLYEQSRELSVADERNRLARELHDAMTQTLFSLRLTVEAAASLLPDPPSAAADRLAEARTLVDATFAELRALVLGLRPPSLDADGLEAAVRKHLGVVGRAHGVAVSVEASGAGRLAAEAELGLFRIVQEAVSNAVRHGRPSSVVVELALGGPVVRVAVRDDGAGFDPDARAVRSRRLGLTSMRERAHALGGRLLVASSPGAGTTVEVEVPGA